MELVTGLHRKSLVRLLGQASLARKRGPRRPRRRTYGTDVEHIVAVVWESLDYVCAERLTPLRLPTAQHLAGLGELSLTPALAAQLARISRPTVQRMLSRLPHPPRRLPRRGPEQANRLRQALPMRRIPWDTPDPGHCEVDLVHHGGESTAGEYAHTLQLVDVATGWSERIALLGRSQRGWMPSSARSSPACPSRSSSCTPNLAGADGADRSQLVPLSQIVPIAPASRARLRAQNNPHRGDLYAEGQGHDHVSRLMHGYRLRLLLGGGGRSHGRLVHA